MHIIIQTQVCVCDKEINIMFVFSGRTNNEIIYCSGSISNAQREHNI